MQKLNQAGLIFASIIITGCAVAPVAVENCAEVDTPLSEFTPPDGSTRKVVFLGFDDSKTKRTDLGLAELAESATTTVVSKTGAEVADSSLAESLRKEIQRYEIRGTSSYSSNLATDAIEGEIVNTTLTASFTARQQYQSGDSVEWSAAYCTYSATVTGTLKIYSVNPLALVKTIPLTGSSSSKKEMGNSSCPVPAGQDRELYRSAALNIAKVNAFTDGIFAHFPVVGHVREVRMCKDSDEGNFLWLSINPEQGASPGSDATIYQQYWFEDKLNDSRVLRRRQVTSGRIVPTNNPNEAWVQIKEREAVQRVKLGDIAEITHSECNKQYEWMCNVPGL